MRSSFLLDGMLGDLCRKLRLLGYDARLHSGAASHLFLIEAQKEGRIAVTTASRQVDRKGPPPLVIHNAPVERMVAELFRLSGETFDPAPFTRCLSCNAMLRPVLKEEVRGRVPERVYRDFDDFRQCPVCGRFFWQGSHYTAMLDEVRRIEDAIG